MTSCGGSSAFGAGVGHVAFAPPGQAFASVSVSQLQSSFPYASRSLVSELIGTTSGSVAARSSGKSVMISRSEPRGWTMVRPFACVTTSSRTSAGRVSSARPRVTRSGSGAGIPAAALAKSSRRKPRSPSFFLNPPALPTVAALALARRCRKTFLLRHEGHHLASPVFRVIATKLARGATH
jgi:hypothetical protein